jgi:hypothetical protein
MTEEEEFIRTKNLWISSLPGHLITLHVLHCGIEYRYYSVLKPDTMVVVADSRVMLVYAEAVMHAASGGTMS